MQWPPRARYASLLLVTCCLVAWGCGGRDPLGRLAVSGSVTLDGRALDQGTIHFESKAGGSGHGSGTVIRDGRYELSADHGVPPGKYAVSISSPEPLDREPSMGQYVPPPAERVPPRYNTQTTLEVEVTASAPNSFDFHLRTRGG